jgi:hypothetical protein
MFERKDTEYRAGSFFYGYDVSFNLKDMFIILYNVNGN